MDNLNILAGPILRRTEKHRTCIWLVTNLDTQVTGILYEDIGDALSEVANSQDSGSHQHIKVSDSCFVHMLQVTSHLGLPTDTRLFYDCYFGDATDNLNLKKLGLVKTQYNNTDNAVYLNLNGLPLPSFYIPTKIERYLHGSCFKLHGDGPESFSKGEHLLQESVDQPLTKRPACLFLTGDQIYADDVSDSTLFQLTRFISNTLKTHEDQAPWLASIKPQLEIGKRSSLFKKKSHPRVRKGERIGYSYTNTFTSGAAENHLISFSEYFGLHLLCWNPEHWDDEAYKQLGISGYRIRRLLANTPTYMMFDDHDVTDDWNINQNWQDTVQKDNLTRKVVSNGLAAFFLCQGWGNNPDAFDTSFVDNIQHYLNNISDPAPVTTDLFERQLWNFHQWSFSVPTTPAILAMDTRTTRQHHCNHKVSGLIDERGFDRLKQLWNDANSPKDIILISPCPVLGQEFLEWIQQLMTKVGMMSTVDAEFWRGDKATFNQLMSLFNNTFSLDRCVILSGDVHHSYAFKGTLRHNSKETIIQQFTCSALRNHSTAWDLVFPQKKLDGSECGVPRQKMQGFHLKQKGKKKLDHDFGIIRTLPIASSLKLDIEPITSDTGLAVITHNSIGEIYEEEGITSQITHGKNGTNLKSKFSIKSI